MEFVYALIIAAAIVALLLVLRKTPPSSSAEATRPAATPGVEGQTDADADAETEASGIEAQPCAPANPSSATALSSGASESESGVPDAEPFAAAGGAAEAGERASAEVESEPRLSLQHITDVAGLRAGLAKSRSESGFFGRLRALFVAKRELSEALASEMEEVLLSSDVGVKTTSRILESIRDALSRGELSDESKVWAALHSEALAILRAGGESGSFPLSKAPTVVFFVGVNGSGKTTTIGKLATRLTAEGRKCVLAAADTFRAAAVQQLVIWGERVGVEVVRGKEGADPGSVVFDAIKRAKELGADVVLADTAGRLHTKSNLMAELQKVARTADKAMAGAPHEVLLVLDATNGQNALAQATEFTEALPLTGLVLTKLDGTAKGGMVLGVCDSLRLPVRFIGLGERADDLRDFVPEEFVEALLGKEADPS